MKKRAIVLTVLCGAFLALLTKMPLAWVGPHILPKTAGQNPVYSGTVWNGAVNGLDVIGTADFTITPLAMFKGQLPISFRTNSESMQSLGKASYNRLKDYRFTGQLSQLPIRDGRLKNLIGDVNFTIRDMAFWKECKSASGQATTDFLARNVTHWRWKGPVLSGPISCEDGDLIVKLSGVESGQTIRADLQLSFNGSYRADISVRTGQPEAGIVLPLYGFDKIGEEFLLTEQGQWR